MGVKQKVKASLVKFIPPPLRWEIERSSGFVINPGHEVSGFVNLSFSQEGEDLVLQRLIGAKQDGFYIDIGAHHPFRFSNTYKFYLQGWKGINIDPLPGSMLLFNEKRPRDINLEMAVLNNEAKKLTYYMFEEPALNSFDETIARHRINNATSKLIDKRAVPQTTLSAILDLHLPADTNIDFLSVDVEGMELDVLSSNDWGKYRPNYIVVESLDTKLEDDLTSKTAMYLREKQYQLIAKTVFSMFFACTEGR